MEIIVINAIDLAHMVWDSMKKGKSLHFDMLATENTGCGGFVINTSQSLTK